MDVLRVIAEPKRRQILGEIWHEERSSGEIASRFEVTFGAISQHLRILREAGLVHVRKDGNQRFYRTDPESLGSLRPLLEEMWADRLDTLAEAVEDGDV